MSYAFTISFLEVPQDEVMAVCTEIVNEHFKNKQQVIEENCMYAPPVRNFCMQDVTVNQYRKSPWKEADRFWLKQLFQVEFLYWEQYGLLGIVGIEMPPLERKPVSVYFQNSTDRDYEYTTWAGIGLFERICEEIQAVAEEELTKRMVQDNNDSDETPDVEYTRKTAVYDQIYQALDLDSWLWKRDGNFINLTMGPAREQVDWLKLSQDFEKTLLDNGFLSEDPKP